ncbi:MAG: response regulator [Thermoanaerobaculia bacterium]
MRVFVADDSKPVRERLLSVLGDIPGVEVVGEAEDALAARVLITALQPDVVILDINMPGGSGIEVLREIKGQSPAPTVIMLTNHSQPQYKKRGLEAGADFFLDKSTEFEQIRDILRSGG